MKTRVRAQDVVGAIIGVTGLALIAYAAGGLAALGAYLILAGNNLQYQ
jgi:uncharacterized membrane protein YuzA (DUF378 family)